MCKHSYIDGANWLANYILATRQDNVFYGLDLQFELLHQRVCLLCRKQVASASM